MLSFDEGQFAAELRTGESVRGQFHFVEAAAQDTLTLVGESKTLVYTVDVTLGRLKELTSLKLSDAGSKSPPFSLFLRRA